jgi:hypothetical protein
MHRYFVIIQFTINFYLVPYSTIQKSNIEILTDCRQLFSRGSSKYINLKTILKGCYLTQKKNQDLLN